MVGVLQKRFEEGLGERFLENGRTRCQSFSYRRLRALREELDDFDSPADSFWPNAQCKRPAEPGTYGCKYHNNGSLAIETVPKSYLEVFPHDITEKLAEIGKRPDYMNRRDDINLMQARVMQLGERLRGDDSEEAWGEVSEALGLMYKGEFVKAKGMLEKALDYHENEKETWKEIRDTEQVLKDLTVAQVKTAKEMRMVATYEQIMRLYNNLYEIITSGITTYISDPREQRDFRDYAAGQFAELIGAGPTGPVAQAVLVERDREREAESVD